MFSYLILAVFYVPLYVLGAGIMQAYVYQQTNSSQSACTVAGLFWPITLVGIMLISIGVIFMVYLVIPILDWVTNYVQSLQERN